MPSLKGRAQTVLGPVDPDHLGCTLTHDNMNYSIWFCPPSPGQEPLSEGPTGVKNLFIKNPCSHKENLLLHQETDPMKEEEELLHFKAAGGGTIEENTTTGIGQNMNTLKKLAEEIGVHIIAEDGFYVDSTLSPQTQAVTVEQLTGIIIDEILNGADRTNLKCSVVREVGCSWPLTLCEHRVLQAAAAQSQLGCLPARSIHLGRNSDSPFQIIHTLQESGADISKTVMSHLDRTIFVTKKLLEFAKIECYLEYDLFGTEFLCYRFYQSLSLTSDFYFCRIHVLIDGGCEDRILIAYDVHDKNRLMKYGGHGYSHILNVAPKMLIRGISQDKIDKTLLANPKRWLTFKQEY
ncbi:LOW QUALITY PROTEIN: N-acetyltaurine hydrolase [Phaethornis superciliosus]